MKRASFIVAAAMCLLSACTKEPRMALELVAEGMGGGTKMYVNGLASYWQTGDMVNINGVEYSITVSDDHAYVDGEFSADNYCIVFPSSLYQSRTGNNVTLNMPATYQYRTVSVNGQARQVLDAPLAYCGDANGGRAQMKHLTGALNLQITGPSGIIIDRITVGTTQNRVMSGEMQFDLSDINSIGSSETNSTANNTVQMLFDNYTFTLSGTKIVQIPVPTLTGNVNFTIKVEGHLEGTKYTFYKTQSVGGHLGRGVQATVSVNLSGGDVSTSALFPTSMHNGYTYYEIHTPQDLRLMSDAVYGTDYREDGDWYNRDWEYNSLKYKNANYYIAEDLDMSGCSIDVIVDYNGIFNGGNHTISNLVVRTRYSNESTIGSYGGLFAYGDNVTVSFVNFNNLTINAPSDDDAYIGAIFGHAASTTWINNVNITNFRIGNRSSFYWLQLGGFIGRTALSGSATLRGCSLSFATGQTIGASTVVTVGGITPPYRFASSVPMTISLNDVTVDFSNLNIQNTNNASCYFGGLIGNGAYTYIENGITTISNVTIDNTTIAGNVSISGGNYCLAGKVSTHSSTACDAINGVNVSGLTINGE